MRADISGSMALSAAKFGDHDFAAFQGDGVNAIQDEKINEHGDGGECRENDGCEPDVTVGTRGQKSQGAEAQNDGLDSEAGQGGGLRGALAAERAHVNFFRCVYG